MRLYTFVIPCSMLALCRRRLLVYSSTSIAALQSKARAHRAAPHVSEGEEVGAHSRIRTDPPKDLPVIHF